MTTEQAAIARRRVHFVNAYQLHMRPATNFVELAQSIQSEVRVDFQGIKVNGKSLLDMTGAVMSDDLREADAPLDVVSILFQSR